MLTGKVTGVEYAKNKDGSKEVLLLQLEITDPDDIRGVQLDTLAGIDSNPPNNSRATVLDLGGYQVAVAVDDQVTKTADQGESEIYSSGSGVKLARVKCDKNGKIIAQNDLQTIKGLFADLVTVVKGIVTTGSPTSHVIDAATQALLDAWQVKVELLFDEE